MTLKGQESVITHHAATIVGNTNETPAAGFDFNPDIGRTGIKRILEQFFHH